MEAALETFELVIDAPSKTGHDSYYSDPSKSMAKFHHALVLSELGRYEEAHLELQEIVELCPKEAAAHVLMGRVSVCSSQNTKDSV